MQGWGDPFRVRGANFRNPNNHRERSKMSIPSLGVSSPYETGIPQTPLRFSLGAPMTVRYGSRLRGHRLTRSHVEPATFSRTPTMASHTTLVAPAQHLHQWGLLLRDFGFALCSSVSRMNLLNDVQRAVFQGGPTTG